MFTKVQGTIGYIGLVKDDLKAAIEARGGSVNGLTFDRWGEAIRALTFGTPTVDEVPPPVIDEDSSPVDSSVKKASIFVHDNNLVEYRSGAELINPHLGDSSYSPLYLYRVWAISDQNSPNGLRFTKDTRTELYFTGTYKHTDSNGTQFSEISTSDPGYLPFQYDTDNRWLVYVDHPFSVTRTVIERQPEDNSCLFILDAIGSQPDGFFDPITGGSVGVGQETTGKIFWRDISTYEPLTASLLFEGWKISGREPWMDVVDSSPTNQAWINQYRINIADGRYEFHFNKRSPWGLIEGQLVSTNGAVIYDGTTCYTVMDGHYDGSYNYLIKRGIHTPYIASNQGYNYYSLNWGTDMTTTDDSDSIVYVPNQPRYIMLGQGYWITYQNFMHYVAAGRIKRSDDAPINAEDIYIAGANKPLNNYIFGVYGSLVLITNVPNYQCNIHSVRVNGVEVELGYTNTGVDISEDATVEYFVRKNFSV
jgi:hypothetical protein